MRAFFLVLGLSSMLASCLAGKLRQGDGAGSKLTSVTVAVPNKEQFTPDEELQTRLNKIRLSVITAEKAADHCTKMDPAEYDWTDSTTASKKLDTLKLLKGCDYSIKVELGEYSTTTKKLVAYFEGQANVKASDIANKDTYDLDIYVTLTKEGADAGFKVTGVAPVQDPTKVDVNVKYDPYAVGPSLDQALYSDLLKNNRTVARIGVVSGYSPTGEGQKVKFLVKPINENPTYYVTFAVLANSVKKCAQDIPPTRINVTGVQQSDLLEDVLEYLSLGKKTVAINVRRVTCGGVDFDYAELINETNL